MNNLERTFILNLFVVFYNRMFPLKDQQYSSNVSLEDLSGKKVINLMFKRNIQKHVWLNEKLSQLN